ncbi:hypothetical protein K503DRAFT_772889 [Rhizopogon vinicolor AM-OR11-026]|uniref:Uncharacterized protein n=1 Tax=Rhizopogon vinicolor AM-OR11-026 TaxID=1314800 RepID=A0A1B7MTW8_9AGAM|nr:hypothetical protein K503DRAFT_772889 [Rhizopogon vinicolor AM-OR11-026]
MLRWCLSTVRVLGSVDGAQGTRLLSSASAYVHESFARFQTTNARGNSTSLADTAHLHIEDSPSNTSDYYCRVEDSEGADGYVHTALITRIQELQHTGKSSRGGNETSDGQERGTSHSHSSTRAISALQEILTSPGIPPDPSGMPTPNTIRSLYISAKARGQLSQLDSGMLSTLIALFGSLSVDPSSRCVYTSSLLLLVKGGPVTRDYWAFVKEVVSLKQQRGMTLAHSDRYWMMRAELASLPPCKEGQCSNTPAFKHFLLRARHQYLRLSRHAFDPEVHVPYVTTLLSSTDPNHRRWAVDAMSSIIRTHPFLHTKVMKVLWDIVHDADAILLGSLLAAISFRVARSPSRCEDATGLPIPAVPVDATTFATSLSAFPFPTPSASTHGRVITELLHEALSSDVPTVQRQNNLLICYLLHDCNGNGIPISSLDLPPDPGVSMWKILFGLAILEKVTQAAGPALLRDLALRGRVREMIRSLQDSWLHLMRSGSHSTLISRAVTTSLFRLAGAVADMKLFAACLESSETSGLWNGNSSDPVEGAQLRAMAAMHLAASVQIHGCRVESVMKNLTSFPTDVQHRGAVLSVAVKELIHRNVELARMLYSIAFGSGSVIDVDTAYALARTLPPPHAARFLRDERFSREQLGGILSSIARDLRDTRPRRYDADIYGDIGISLCKLYATSLPPSHFRGHLQLLLFELCAHGSGSQCAAIIASVIKFQPTFFQPSFLLRLIGLLLRRKQFRYALRIQRICVDARVRCAFKLRCMVAKRLWAPDTRRLSTNISLPGRKANTLFRGDRFWRAGTLFKSTISSGAVLNTALQSLICNGRAHAAKVAFNRVVSKVDTRARTILGNTLLHGVLVRPVPRNGRRVRKFLVLLDNLVKCHGFAPDRITVNIVLKALLSWRSAFDHQRLRALFDHMVRGGYPAGTYSPSRLPFSTPPLRTGGSLALSKLPPYISFDKHAKPLFKMFIKGFYLRNDVEAARMVVEIMKIEQQKATLQRAQRLVARLRGHEGTKC